MKQVIRIFRTLAALVAVTLLGACQETMENPGDAVLDFPVPDGEIPFVLRMGEVGDADTRSEVFGEPSSTLTGEAIQMLCFDESGYYMGLRQAYIETSNTPQSGGSASVPGTFSGYVPIGTARIHFVANAHLDDPDHPFPFTIGTSENVVMHSRELSTYYLENSVKFWGYKRCSTAAAMKTWLTQGVPTTNVPNPTPNVIWLLRDRARITLSFATGVLTGYSVQWTVFNGRDRGYIAPFDGSSEDPWEDYDVPTTVTVTNDQNQQVQVQVPNVLMTEFKESGRYSIYDRESHTDIATWENYDVPQYVFDDSNTKSASGEDGRVRIILKVSPTGGGDPKYLLLLMRDKTTGDQIQITRNHTYNFHITSLAGGGYSSLERATDPSAHDYANAPADVDPEVPSVSDGNQILELLAPGPTVVVRQQGATIPVSFSFKNINTTNGTLSDPYPSNDTGEDFAIYWEDNDQAGWDIGNLTHSSGTGTPWEFDLTIGSIGHTYALDDYLIIRHRLSGLSRSVHVYAVDAFHYRVNPTLVQVERNDSPYLGPSGDDVKRPVFKLSFQLPESLGEDMFPLTMRFATSSLEPYGDKGTSYLSRRSGGFGLVNASTSQSWDGVSLASSNDGTDWNYNSDSWNYWYEYTLDEYPEDGEVVVYFKDIRDARAQASNQDVGLYLDIRNFTPVGLSVPMETIEYPSYSAGSNSGVYTVGKSAARYRASITGCSAGTYTLSSGGVGWLSLSPESVTVAQDGTFDFFFTVDENTGAEHYVDLVFTNGSEVTTVRIIQEGIPGVAGLQLRSLSTEVNGNVTMVELNVYSVSPWTLTSSGGPDGPQGDGGTFSYSSNAGSATATLTGAATSSSGTIVKFFMPGNYTTNDVSYLITATNTNDTATEDVTQLGGTLVDGSASFLAANYREKYPNASESRPVANAFIIKDNSIRGTFDMIYDYNEVNGSSKRFDITPGASGNDQTATFDLVIDKQVKKITRVTFYFFHEVILDCSPQSYSAIVDNNPSSHGTFDAWYTSLSYTKDMYWTGEAYNNVHFDFTARTTACAFVQIDVYYQKIVWD